MQKRVIYGAVALSAAMASPITATAAEVSLSYGATLTSEYVSSGVRYSDGVAFQPYVELGFGAFYAGAYATNADVDFAGYDREAGLSLGYRGEAGSLSYDLSVNYYFFGGDPVPVDAYAEFVASGTLAASDTIYVTGTVAYAPDFEGTNASLRVDYYTAVEGLSLDATFGNYDDETSNWTYWSAGATYQISDTVGVGLAYHDSKVDPSLGFNSDGLIVASLNFAFSTP